MLNKIILVTKKKEEDRMNLVQLLPLVAIFVIFYFMLIRPQKKQQQAHQQMLANLKVGDYILTIGGVKGVVTKIKDTEVRVRVATNVEIDFIRTAIARLDSREESEE